MCAGIAGRLHVDPLVIRGVFVVAALLGLPMLLVYAIAWALLPDAADRILLQQRGRFKPAIIGVVVVFVLGLIPVIPWLFGGLLAESFAGVSEYSGTDTPALLHSRVPETVSDATEPPAPASDATGARFRPTPPRSPPARPS